MTRNGYQSMGNEYRFKVRNFGNDTVCGSIEALMATLAKEYANESVSIQYRTKATGMIQVVFVDVEPDAIRHSYQDRNEVDFVLLDAEAM